MTDHDDSDYLTVDIRIEHGIDSIGDPVMRLEAEFPKDAALRPSQVRDIGVQLIAASAQAEANAMIGRQMMLDGMPRDAVAQILAGLLGPSGPGDTTSSN